jgi:dihydroorotase
MEFKNLYTNKKENIIIKNGLIINPTLNEPYKSDILISNGIITEIKENLFEKDNIKNNFDNFILIEAKDLFVCPGFIDMHVHLREPGNEYEEDIDSGTKSALRGGITSIACMPNTNPVIDCEHLVKYIKLRSQEVGYNIYPVAAITKNLQGEIINDLKTLKNEGAIAFSDDGKCIQNARLMYEVMRYCAEFNALLILHEEDYGFSNNGVMHEGYYSTLLGLDGISSLSEDLMISRDILLAKITGARIHITHVSSARAIKMIEIAKNEGVKVTCDTTSEHLFFNDSFIQDYNTNFKIKPPIRSEEDRIAIISGLKNGVIDAIASDHAPHLSIEKDVSFNEASFGSIGMETLFKASLSKLYFEENFPIQKIISLISFNPSNILNIENTNIEKGKIANISIVDINTENTYKIKDIVSKSKNSTFLNQNLKGEIKYTIVNGKLMFINE